VAGREAEVIGVSCDPKGIKMLKMSQPKGPVFKYDPPNESSFGDQPLLCE